MCFIILIRHFLQYRKKESHLTEYESFFYEYMIGEETLIV